MTLAVVHGTIDGYQNHACRCESCRAANTDWCRVASWQSGRRRPLAEVQAERVAAADARDNHGSETRYNRGCRCRRCKDGAAAARRRRREAGSKLSREQTLDWLQHMPAYRELIRARISEAQKRVRLLDQKREQTYAMRDQLGREIEGCG